MYVDTKRDGYAGEACTPNTVTSGGRFAGTTLRAVSPEPAWENYVRSGRVRSVNCSVHDLIFSEDEPARHLYEIASGNVMLYRLLSDGRRQVIDLLSKGDIFGFSRSGLYDCSAETLMVSELRVLESRDIEESADLQRYVNRCLMTRLDALHSHTVLLGRKSAQERVASFLMRFVVARGEVGCTGPKTGEDSTSLPLRMTRQEIADYLGLTIETVSRVLSDMKRRGLIVLEKNDRVHLPNICRLCRLTGIH